MTSAGIGSLCHQGDGNNIQTPTAGTGAIISAPSVTSVITELLVLSVLYSVQKWDELRKCHYERETGCLSTDFVT